MRRYGAVAVLLVLWTAAMAAPPPARVDTALLEAARTAEAAGDDRRVVELVGQWLDAQSTVPPEAELAAAWYLIGKASWRLKRPDDATFYLKKLVKETPGSLWVADASLLLGQIADAQGATAEAIGHFEKAAAGLKSSPEARRPIVARLVELYRQTGKLDKAIDALLTVRRVEEASGDLQAAAAVTEQIDGLIAGESDPARLTPVVNAMARRYPADRALLRLADLAAARKEPYEEEQWLKRFLADFPKQPQAEEIAHRLRANVEAIKAKSAVVGLLLPLSGPARLFGRSALRGAQVALEAAMVPAAPGRETIGVAIRDSQSDMTTEALGRWAEDFDLVALVGPLLTREVERVAPLAQRKRLPVLSPGAQIGTARPLGEPPAGRDYLFWNGLTLAQQARAAASYAVTGAGVTRFMILYPDAPYGVTATEAFSAVVAQLGGEVIAAIGYPPNSTDFGQPLRAMKNADLARYGVIGPPIEGKPPDDWPYTPGFDALFLPGSAEAAGMIASQLAFHGYERLLLLGAGDWNRPELFAFGGRFVDGAVLVDGFFAKSDAPHVREFVRRYQMRYHEEPDLFAAQGYDAMRMVISAIEQGAGDGEEVRDYLSGIKRYPGVSGPTTLVEGGPAEKEAVLVKAQNGRFVLVQ
jgi:ABC-type branched-subunit amino acid transport system substrate-binding protein